MNPFLLSLLLFASLLQASDLSVNFLFFGDQGNGNQAQYEVAKGMSKFCNTHDCQFALLLGDNFYDKGVESTKDPQWKTKFIAPYQLLNFQFFAVLGNHDHYGNYRAEIEYSLNQKKWIMPGRYYHFSKMEVDFFGIDSEDFDPTQISWLNTTLKASTSVWKIVFGHHPIYSYGMHGSTPKLAKALLPLAQNQMDFYLCGHEHDIQVIERNKVKTVVSGTASEVRPTASGEGTLFSASKLGFSYLHLDGNKAELMVLDKNGETLYQKEWAK